MAPISGSDGVLIAGVLDCVEELFDAFSIHDRNRAYEAGDHHSMDIWLPASWKQVTTWLRQVEALR